MHKRAVGKYLAENQPPPWACKHAPLNYVDFYRDRCWDADKFLDSEWVVTLNQEAEKAFRNRIIARSPNINNVCEMEEKILEMHQQNVALATAVK